MKISKSKQELASIISENGGWRGGSRFYISNRDGAVLRCESKPSYSTKKGWLSATGILRQAELEFPLANWHQTILSREEYFHLYPSPDTDGWIEWKGGAANHVKFGELVDVKLANGEVLNRVSANSGAEWRHCWGDTNIIAYRLHKPDQAKPEFCDSVMRSIPEPSDKPTIEQLAADYQNARDYAERKQQEADDAKADADEKLRVLELAGEAIGLLVSPITEKQEPELVIGVQVGDEVECVESNIKRDKYNGMVGRLHTIDESDTSTPYLVDFGNEARIWCHEVKFIRRP